MMIIAIIREKRKVISKILFSIDRHPGRQRPEADHGSASPADKITHYKPQTSVTPLIKGEFYPGRQQQQCNGVDRIGKGIDVGHQVEDAGHSDGGRYRVVISITNGRGPIVQDHIEKIDYETDTYQEAGITKKIPVLMRDHEIDSPDAEQHDRTIIKDAKIGAERSDLAIYEVDDDPEQRGQAQKAIKYTGFLFQETPDMELPGDQGPFQQRVNIYRDGIMSMKAFDQDETDHFRDKPDP